MPSDGFLYQATRTVWGVPEITCGSRSDDLKSNIQVSVLNSIRVRGAKKAIGEREGAPHGPSLQRGGDWPRRACCARAASGHAAAAPPSVAKNFRRRM